MASLLKGVSDFTANVLLLEKELFSWKNLLKRHPFELIQMQQKLFQFFLPQEAWAFENNIEKEPQKPRPKLKKLYALYISTLSTVQRMW